MFICDQCYKYNKLTNMQLMRSVGPCEICGYTASCSDIKSGFINSKYDKKDHKHRLIAWNKEN